MASSIYYSGVTVDYTAKTIKLNLEDPGDSVSLYDLWRDAFDSFDKVNVCLSGGIDSQFVCSVLSTLKKDVTVYIFSFVWDDCVFNSPDVMHAVRCCERFRYKYKQVEIDYKQLLESGKFLECCTKYRVSSPQLALQLTMLEYIDNDYPIFLGGDIPMINYNFDTKQTSIVSVVELPDVNQPFLNYSTINNRIVIKDILRCNPEIHFLAYKSFLKTSMTHKLVCTDQTSTGGAQPFRKLYYTDIGCNMIPPLLKNTGFEILKMHLAKQTGVYNEYDLRYRYPLIEILKRESWYHKQFKLKSNNQHLLKIDDEFRTFCQNEQNLKTIELYNFIL